MKAKLQAVEVTWRDAAISRLGWLDAEDYAKNATPVIAKTMGYLNAYDKRMVQLVSAVAEDGQVNMSWSIPRDWVLKVRTLKGAK